MNCETYNLYGIPEECDANIGGIKKIVLYSGKASGAAITIGTFTGSLRLGSNAFTEDNMPEGVTTTMDEDEFEDVIPYIVEYIPQHNSSSVESTQTIDNANGINFTETNINLNFSKEDLNKYKSYAWLTAANEGSDLHGFYLDNNDNWYMVGGFESLIAQEGTINTGANVSDGQTITIGLHDNGPYAPIPVIGTLANALNRTYNN